MVFSRISDSFQKGVGITVFSIGSLYLIAHFIPSLPDLNGITVNISSAGIEVVDGEDGQLRLPEEDSLEENKYEKI